MVDGTRTLVAAAREAGVERFVLMSALGTGEPTPATVPYYRSKWAMEQEVAGSGLEHTIFRPSFVFGRRRCAAHLREAGALLAARDRDRGRPPALAADLGRRRRRVLRPRRRRPKAANRTFELGGPDIVNWNELYLLIAKVLGKRRRLVHVPFAVARAGARLTQRLRAPHSRPTR